MCGDFVEL